MDVLGAILVLLGVAIIYMTPWIIAKARNHHNSLAIFWLTLLTGWTVLGWVAAFIWGLTSPRATPA